MSDWTDITVACRNAALEMTDENPMITIDDFSLFDSMNATELMDSKVDPCYGINGTTSLRTMLTYYPVSCPLPHATVARLLQSLFVYESVLLDGTSLMDSIHNCIFTWKQGWESLETHSNETEKLICSFSKSIVKTATHIFGLVLAADVYEEDDFLGFSRYSLPTHDQMPDTPVIEGLDSAISTLSAESTDEQHYFERYICSLLKLRREIHCFFSALSPWVIDTVTDASKKIQNTKHHKSFQEESSPFVINLETVDQTCRSLIVTKKHALRVNAAIADIESAHAKYLDSLPNVKSHSDFPDLDFAYNKIVGIMSHPPGAIRHVPLKTFRESLTYYKSIMDNVLQVGDVLLSFFQPLQSSASTNKSSDIPDITVEQLLCTSLDLSRLKLHLVARSMYVSGLYHFAAHYGIANTIRNSMLRKGVPRAIVEYDLVAKHWLNEVPVSTVWETLKDLCSNRSKLFSKMEALLSSWGVLSHHATIVDAHFRDDFQIEDEQQTWLSWWVLSLTTIMMDANMSLILEMNMLEICDLDYFYWYWDFICSTNVWSSEQLRRLKYEIDSTKYSAAQSRYDTAKQACIDKQAECDAGTATVKAAMVAASTASVAPKKNVSNARKKQHEQQQAASAEAVRVSSEALAANTSQLTTLKDALKTALDSLQLAGDALTVSVNRVRDAKEPHEMLMKAKGFLCKGLYRVLILYTQMGLIRKPENPYMSWEMRFERRFKAFSTIHNPPPLALQSFWKSFSVAAEASVSSGPDSKSMAERYSGIDQNVLLSAAIHGFNSSKSTLEELRKNSGGGVVAAAATAVTKVTPGAAAKNVASVDLHTKECLALAIKYTKSAVSNAVATTKATTALGATIRTTTAASIPASTIAAAAEAIVSPPAPPPLSSVDDSIKPAVSLKISYGYCSEFPTVEIVSK